jgi:pyruvate/2-oxoglutarate dehydrogenase complex dihydrolipoamide acyltransferase (E2) component
VSSSRTDAGAGRTTLVDVTMPQMGVSVAEGTVVAWRVEVGDRIEADQTICEISTDKIDTEVPAPVSGVVAEILVQVETTVSVGTVLARIATGGAGTAAAHTGAAEAGATDAGARHPLSPDARDSGAVPAGENSASGLVSSHDSGNGHPRRYSPVVQRIAAEHGINLDEVPGTGRNGRVRKQDVLAFIDSASPPEEAPLHIESPYRAEPASPAAVTDGGQLSRMRRQIGEHMKRSLDTAAHCTTWIEIDMSRVESARTRLRVTALAFVARAAIDALREHPALNASLEGERYTVHSDVNLGIAVSLAEDGLIVPVIHKAHELSVEGLAARIRDLAARARSRQLGHDEVRGGTFTITNPGQYGSIMATPIINQPQVGILDLETVTKRPVVVTDGDGNDSIAIRPMTILGLSWDHRALDGAQAALFLSTVKRYLEGLIAS